MTANNKILIALIAVTAFVIGAAINSARVSNNIQTDVLLTAQLLEGDFGADETKASTINDKLGDLTLVNFWASWCAPCREEMPIFETMYRGARDQGFQIIGIAIDSVEKTQPMLDSMDISYPILYAEQTGMKIMESAGNPQGLLPYSLLLNKDGEVIEQVLGKIDETTINTWLTAANITLPQAQNSDSSPISENSTALNSGSNTK